MIKYLIIYQQCQTHMLVMVSCVPLTVMVIYIYIPHYDKVSYYLSTVSDTYVGDGQLCTIDSDGDLYIYLTIIKYLIIYQQTPSVGDGQLCTVESDGDLYILYIYTIANSHIKVTDRCYIRDIHPTTGGREYETTGLI